MFVRKDKNGKEFPRYATNPWMNALIETSRTKNKMIAGQDKNKFAVLGDKRTGELGEIMPTGFFYQKKLESNAFVKMYTAGIAEIMGLSKAGARVFMYLFDVVSEEKQMNNTAVLLKYDYMIEDAKYNIKDKPMSKATFMNGLKNLIEHGFIAQSQIQHLFYYNPLYMFNGDRLVIVNEYIKEKRPKELQ